MTEIQPFTTELTIHDPETGSNNSTDYTGQVLSPPLALRDYIALANVPPQTKTFLIEVTTAGGIGGDSLANLTIDQAGNHNAVSFQAVDVALWSGTAGNAINVEYVDPGAASQPLTVAVAGNDITISWPRTAPATLSVRLTILSPP